MSLSTILIVLVFVVLLVYLNTRTKPAPKPSPSTPTPPPSVTTTQTPVVPTPKPSPTPPPPAGPKVYEMIDFENPRLSVNNETLTGSRMLVLPDSKRANELRKRFDAKNVLDRIEFHEGSNVIEVYRVVSDNVYTYMFPDAKSDENIIKLVTQVSEDPSSKRPKKNDPPTKMSKPVGVPPELISAIQSLEVSYSKRKSSTGPRAIDTHSS
jgi:hypothetical protein